MPKMATAALCGIFRVPPKAEVLELVLGDSHVKWGHLSDLSGLLPLGLAGCQV